MVRLTCGAEPTKHTDLGALQPYGNCSVLLPRGLEDYGVGSIGGWASIEGEVDGG